MVESAVRSLRLPGSRLKQINIETIDFKASSSRNSAQVKDHRSSRSRASLFYSPSPHAGPDIWLEYAQYSIGGMGAAGGIDRVRAVFERALTAVGLHVTKGAALWEAFREFEIAILSTLQVPELRRSSYRVCFCVRGSPES